ncbi:hypothetical protein CY35_19G095800 [Sphagnum magellanicum]|nr:hypothetical protein CY35_19G095800 [Sphagnum magellanicum]
MLYLPLTPCPALHSPESPQLEMPATGACLCPEDCNQYELLECMSQHLGRRRKVLHLWIFNSLRWRQVTMPRRQRSTPHPEAG